MQGMQNTQNAQNAQNMFSFSPAPGPSGQASGLKTESGEKEAQGEGFFASFLASLTQAVERADTGKNTTSPGFLDLTFSAEEGENREEYATSLPLEGFSLEGFPLESMISKPVLDLLASLKEDLGELKEKGVDIDLISQQVDELLSETGETLSEVDAERLESLLARLRSRYETVAASSPRHLDIEVTLSESLKFGLEASLKHPQGEHPQGERPQGNDSPTG